MNCRQFTSHIVEAARGRMMDAAARDAATRHASECAACAARLAQEQNLTGALRTIAAEMKDLSAPARVEAKLLAAFQESLAGAQAAATAPSAATNATAETTAAAGMAVTTATAITTAKASLPAALRASDEMSGRTAIRRQPWRTAFAATAAIAATLALVAFVALYERFAQNAPPAVATTNGATTKGAAQGGRETSPATSPAASPVAIQSTLPRDANPAEQPGRDRPQTPQRVAAQRTSPTGEAQRKSPKSARAATPRMITSAQVIDGGDAIFAGGEVESAANHAGGTAKASETESVTEFIPLVGGAPGATPLESGQLVRVQLPRAALAPLGLPLNAERGNEPVKADVLLGNDGLARAIRFVR